MAIRQAGRAPPENRLVVIALGIALGGIVLLSAPARPDVVNPGFMNFPAIVETVKSSVIGIDANAVDPGGGRLHRSAVSEDDEASPSVSEDDRASRSPPDRGSRGLQRHEVVGSGFLISSDGYAVTNAHVVAGSDSTHIKTTDGKTYTAEIVGIDSTSDVALLKVDGRNDFTAAQLSDRKPRVGEWVLAIGNPFGLDGTVTAGIVSADKRNIGSNAYGDFIQIDAPVNQGNSGGPTFDLDGKVIGINTMILSPTGSSIGIAFAIPVDTLKTIIPELMQKGFVQHGWIGAHLGAITPEIAESLGLPGTGGAIVEDVTWNAPAAKAGLASGDVILSVDGEAIKEPHDLIRRIVGARPGDQIRLGLRRDSQDKIVAVTLGELPRAPGVAPRTVGSASPPAPALGLKLAPGTDREGGVLVTGVDPRGSARQRGLAPGDVITEAGGRSVRSPDDVDAALSKAHGEGKRFVLLRLRSGGATHFVAIPSEAIQSDSELLRRPSGSSQ